MGFCKDDHQQDHQQEKQIMTFVLLTNFQRKKEFLKLSYWELGLMSYLTVCYGSQFDHDVRQS